ncbi:hypothetical protein M6B38_367960 [Iris pallida]|uniref:Secreted protein n=1 Tax=Iris pallida TaxID=29817 RepID=A0AAX6GFT6_IRIPA|nr:hypothetical protein M6B38_367960 [Iris pallida]
MVCFFLLHIRPLPCWVRSHGRSTILNKVIFLVLSGGVRTGIFMLFPRVLPRSCSFCVLVHCQCSSTGSLSRPLNGESFFIATIRR